MRRRPGRPAKGEQAAPSRKRTIHIPLAVDQVLVELADLHGVTVHAEVRTALETYARALKPSLFSADPPRPEMPDAGA